ncbi:hypothetical protein GALMADRAFT_1243962 [Galerina marginata CBS 339.88]|uniref:Uncharacterized protein n=1 Tax=Galerina marginata (strain CBS 339.88) TaxID=685588 RepID=A0A067TKP6_GALM3|nr:hypothetical protein GALMADRAFT_1243962 [Galerina marginata CBS 339.88]
MPWNKFLLFSLSIFFPARAVDVDGAKQVTFHVPFNGAEVDFVNPIASDASTGSNCRRYLNPEPTTASHFVGSTVAPGLPVSTARSKIIDPATPSDAFGRTSRQGLRYEIVWSDEFVMDGRNFGFGSFSPISL